MSKSQNRMGRRLFKTSEPDLSKNQNRVAYSLLRAVPLTLDGVMAPSKLTWLFPELAARLLRCAETVVPKTHETLESFIDGPDRSKRAKAIGRAIRKRGHYSVQYRMNRSDKSQIWVEELGEVTPIVEASGLDDGDFKIQAIMRDVSDERDYQDKSLDRFRYDPVTGFLNTNYFNEIIFHLNNIGQSNSIVRLRISNSEDIKQSFGAVGLLYMFEALAKRIDGQVSPNDYVAFDESGEFQLMFPGASANETLMRSKKLKFIVNDIAVESPYGLMRAECTVSVDTLSGQSIPLKQKTTLAKTQTNATSNVLPFRAGQITKADLKIALDQNRFSLVYQPICRAGSRHVEYYEALLRFTDDDGHLQSAFPYILAAEKCEMIAELDFKALQVARKALAQNPDLKLSLNVSVGTISSERARQSYLSILDQMGAESQNVIVELTETMFVEDPDMVNQFSSDLQSRGVQLAIDDFGAGHTSFKNLMAIEAQIIKIDGAFIRDLSMSEEKQRFVRLLTEMAETFGQKTVAEMIDNEADARTAERLGVNYLQGFHLGRPNPAFILG